jgi:CelD/BcsL family acetyltransferase involved in cellulose biosynthesis
MDGTASPEIELATSGARLEGLRPEWQALWRRTPDANPFQSPAWLLPWWRVFGNGHLLTLAFRDRGTLTGLLPLYLLEEGGVRKLLPLGIGITDRLDPLLIPVQAMLAMDRLTMLRHRFDRIDLADLAAGSPLLELPAPAAWSDERHCCTPRPVLPLPQGAADLRSTVPRLGKLAYYRRRAARLGDAVLELATPASLSDHLESLFQLHAAHWTGRDEPGVLADPRVRAFHRRAAPQLLALGLLRCHALRVDGRIVAVLYALADRGTVHAYLAGYDPRLHHPGLGALMIGHAIEQAAAEGLREFDFLRGREAYKYAWGAIDRPTFGRSLRPPA